MPPSIACAMQKKGMPVPGVPAVIRSTLKSAPAAGCGLRPLGLEGCMLCSWLVEQRREDAAVIQAFTKRNTEADEQITILQTRIKELEGLGDPVPWEDYRRMKRDLARYTDFGEQGIDLSWNPSVVSCVAKTFYDGDWAGWVVFRRPRSGNDERSGDLWYVAPGMHYMFRGFTSANKVREKLIKFSVVGTKAELDWIIPQALEGTALENCALKPYNASFIFGGDAGGEA